jgi:hypothetical protein
MPAQLENFIVDVIRPAVLRAFPEITKTFSYEKTPRRYLRFSFLGRSVPDILKLTYYTERHKKIARVAVTLVVAIRRSWRGKTDFEIKIQGLKKI